MEKKLRTVFPCDPKCKCMWFLSAENDRYNSTMNSGGCSVGMPLLASLDPSFTLWPAANPRRRASAGLKRLVGTMWSKPNIFRIVEIISLLPSPPFNVTYFRLLFLFFLLRCRPLFLFFFNFCLLLRSIRLEFVSSLELRDAIPAVPDGTSAAAFCVATANAFEEFRWAAFETLGWIWLRLLLVLFSFLNLAGCAVVKNKKSPVTRHKSNWR